jgi:hypothetical protein
MNDFGITANLRKMNRRTRSYLQTMPSTLRLSDLHEAYHKASTEDAIAMANLGAICYQTLKANLYEQWSASMEGDESTKAEIWRSEGRRTMLESVKAKLATARLASAEGQIQQLRASVEAEVAKRLT